MRALAAWSLLALVASGIACGSHRGSPGLPAGDTGQDAGDDGGSLVTDASDAGPAGDASPGEASLVGDGATTTDCVPEASLIYVVTEERELYSFDPQKNAFNLLANVDCASGSYANSMAIDRAANAWINYGDGSLWKVSTKQPGCISTGFKPGQQGVGLFGMGFMSKTAGSSTEELFIDDLGGNGLGFIDLSSMTLQLFGPFAGPLANRSAELNGTGDARLFGFFAGSPLGDAGAAAVVQIDPNAESALQEYDLPSVDTGSDWAFSFWGGDFYLFTADKYNQTDPYTTVTRFRPSDGSVTIVDTSIGFRIVGAGSSTCAPTTPAQ